MSYKPETVQYLISKFITKYGIAPNVLVVSKKTHKQMVEEYLPLTYKEVKSKKTIVLGLEVIVSKRLDAMFVALKG